MTARILGMKESGHRSFADAALTESIIGACYYVHSRLGFGFLESVYSAALERVLIRRGLRVAREVLVPIHFEHEIISYQRLDMLVEDRVIAEVKTGERLHEAAPRQLYNYLRATNLEIGLLLHFGRRATVRRIDYENTRKKLEIRRIPSPSRQSLPESIQPSTPDQSAPTTPSSR